MGNFELKRELQAIEPDQMIEAVKATSWKLGSGEDLFCEEYSAFREEYPALATAVDLMIEADVVNGRSREEAERNAVSGAWAFLCLKQLVDTDELKSIING